MEGFCFNSVLQCRKTVRISLLREGLAIWTRLGHFARQHIPEVHKNVAEEPFFFFLIIPGMYLIAREGSYQQENIPWGANKFFCKAIPPCSTPADITQVE